MNHLRLEVSDDFKISRVCSHLRASSQATFLLHPQLTSSFGDGSVSDKEQHCGLHSELPGGIYHCQDT